MIRTIPGLRDIAAACATLPTETGRRLIIPAIPLAITLLGTVPAHGQRVFWTDFYSSVKKLGPGGTVQTLVSDSGITQGLAIDAPAGKMYWVGTDIERANLDGTGRQIILFDVLRNAIGIDIDSVNRKIYWADNQTNTVGRANLDGTGVESVISEYSVLDVAVDPTGGKIYWNANVKSLIRSNLDGTGVEVLINNIPALGDIDIDLVQRKIYWGHFLSGTHYIRRASLDGPFAIEPVVVGGSTSGNLAIGLDDVARKVYWGLCGVPTPDGVKCAIQRANYDGSQKELVVVTGIENWDAFGDIEVIPDPGELCDLTATFPGGTMNLDFSIASSAAATWNLWLSYQNQTIPFWSIAIPAISPPRPFHVPIPGFPALGSVGFLTTVTTSSSGIVCSDWATVNTGTGQASAGQLPRLEFIRLHGPQLNP